MSALSLTGVWWCANAPNEKFTGTLDFNNIDGGKLKLVGALGGVKALTNQCDIGQVFGLADNKLVTVCDAYTTSMTMKAPGPHLHRIASSRVLIGAHLLEAELHFNEIGAEFEYLPEFTNSPTLTAGVSSDKEGNWTGIRAVVRSRKSLEIGKVPGGSASIDFGWSQDSEAFRSVTLKENYSFNFSLESPKPLDEILEFYMRPAQDLVTMATDQPNAIVTISLQNKNYVDEAGRTIKIKLYQRSTLEAKQKRSTLLRHNMLFTLNDLTKSQLGKWLAASEHFRPVVGILFGQRYSKGTYIENRLLNAMSAAEAYHRRRFTNTILDEVAWKAKRRSILNNAGKEKAFLEKVLAFANEKRLKERLDEVLAHSGLLGDLIKEPEAWNKEIRAYRNVLTHYDPKAPTEIKNYDRMYWLSESLSWIMLACMMVEMGFTKKKVLKLLQENERYKFARDRLSLTN